MDSERKPATPNTSHPCRTVGELIEELQRLARPSDLIRVLDPGGYTMDMCDFVIMGHGQAFASGTGHSVTIRGC